MLKLNKFRSAVYKTIENNEIDKNEDFIGSPMGYADVESVCKQYRFKIGIIDFLTSYNSAKFLENKVKAKLNNVDSAQISAIDEASY